MIRLAVAVLVGFALSGSATAACPDGEYVVVGNALLSSPSGAFVYNGDVVTIANGTIAIASGCPATPASFRKTSRGTVVRAQWPVCPGATGVRLRAVVNKPCLTMRGRLATRRPRSTRRFVARQAPCRPWDPCRLCDSNADCGPAAYCARPFGECGGKGACAERPGSCPLSIVAVCGCDGVTYAGACEAGRAGVSVAHVGSCDATCGGIAGIPCDANELCELPAGQCGTPDLQGECVPIPDACPAIYAPVCACDGTTYSSDCNREAAKAQKAHDGPCVVQCADACDCAKSGAFTEPCPLDCATCDNYWTCEKGQCLPHCGPVPQPPPVCEPTVCGGIAGIPCGPAELCELPPGECQTADLQGMCEPLPQVCPDVYAPVCACDGTTYPNDCARQQKGAQKAHDGACEPRCATACDCEKAIELPVWCTQLLCPACGCAWSCDGGTCGVHVESPVPPPACGAIDAPSADRS